MRFVLSFALCYFVLVFFSPFSIAIFPRLGKRELTLVLSVRLFNLRLFSFVCFLFLLVSGKCCGLWLWHSLDLFSYLCLIAYPLNPLHSRVSLVRKSNGQKQNLNNLIWQTATVNQILKNLKGRTATIKQNLKSLTGRTATVNQTLNNLTGRTATVNQNLKNLIALTATVNPNLINLIGLTATVNDNLKYLIGRTTQYDQTVNNLIGRTATVIPESEKLDLSNSTS